jgi:hypothetical protein
MTITLYSGVGTVEQRTTGSVADRIFITGLNTGNVLFSEALSRHIPTAKICADWSDDGESDTLVLSMANMIQPYVEIEPQLRLVRKTRAKKILLIGVGAQAFDYSEAPRLSRDADEFLRTVSHKSAWIGVRGDYTAELLYRCGIKNVRVIGCPSVFLNGSAAMEVRSADLSRPIAVHITPFFWALKNKMSRILAIGMKANAYYVLQSEDSLSDIFDQNDPRQSPHFAWFVNEMCPEGVAPADFASWLSDRGRIFFFADEWIEFMSQAGLSFGTRFHGNVAALLGGTAALTCCVDTRTRELCSYFRMPIIDAHELSRFSCPAELVEFADCSAFVNGYPDRLSEYVGFLDDNAVPHSLHGTPNIPRFDRAHLKRADTFPIAEAVQARTIVRALLGNESEPYRVAEQLVYATRPNRVRVEMNPDEIHAAILSEGPVPQSRIPRMIVPVEERMLRVLARDYFANEGVIVDAGIFAGRSSQILAWALQGRRDADFSRRRQVKPIQSYDLGICDRYMAELLNGHYGLELAPGETFLPILQANLAPFLDILTFHPGDIRMQSEPPPTEILFLDVCKTAAINHSIMMRFLPRLVVGRGILIHQDFIHEWLPWIHIYTALLRDSLSHIGNYGSSSVFLLQSPIKLDLTQDYYNLLPVCELADLIDSVPVPLSRAQRYFITFAKCRMFLDKQADEQFERTLDGLYSEYPICQLEINHIPSPDLLRLYASEARVAC